MLDHSHINAMVDRNLMQLMPGLIKLPIEPLILGHELINLLLPLAHLSKIARQLLPKLKLPLLEVPDHELILLQVCLRLCQIPLQAEHMLPSLAQSFLHEVDVRLEIGEVFGQM